MATTADNKTFTIGVQGIYFGAIANDGGMGTTLATLGYTYQDSASVTTDDPSITEFYSEEVDAPVYVKGKKGKTTLAFSIMNPSLEVFKKLRGGTIDADNETWNEADTWASIELSVFIKTDQGFNIVIPRAQINAKPTGALSNSQLFMLEVSAMAMQPTKSGVAMVSYTTKDLTASGD